MYVILVLIRALILIFMIILILTLNCALILILILALHFILSREEPPPPSGGEEPPGAATPLLRRARGAVWGDDLQRGIGHRQVQQSWGAPCTECIGRPPLIVARMPPSLAGTAATPQRRCSCAVSRFLTSPV